MNGSLKRGRYEVRSASGTAWWHTTTVAAAYRILDSHGRPGDYVYDTVTGGRPERPGKGADA